MAHEESKCICPICKRRLFDIKEGTEGRLYLAVKCPRCRQVSGIIIDKGRQINKSS